jgi:hypothetical protein
MARLDQKSAEAADQAEVADPAEAVGLAAVLRMSKEMSCLNRCTRSADREGHRGLPGSTCELL